MRLSVTREEGIATISIAIVFPATSMLFLTVAQAAMIAVAHDVAISAAEEGVRVARAHYGTPAGGQAAAASFARREPMLLNPQITISGTTTITVSVRGRAPSLLPGIHPTVAGTAHGAHEIFTTETRQFTRSNGSSTRNLNKANLRG
jgi:hypothetical protein